MPRRPKTCPCPLFRFETGFQTLKIDVKGSWQPWTVSLSKHDYSRLLPPLKLLWNCVRIPFHIFETQIKESAEWKMANSGPSLFFPPIDSKSLPLKTSRDPYPVQNSLKRYNLMKSIHPCCIDSFQIHPLPSENVSSRKVSWKSEMLTLSAKQSFQHGQSLIHLSFRGPTGFDPGAFLVFVLSGISWILENSRALFSFSVETPN